MTARPPTLRQLPPHDPRERRLIAALQRQGLTITRGWLVDSRRGIAYPHGRIVKKSVAQSVINYP